MLHIGLQGQILFWVWEHAYLPVFLHILYGTSKWKDNFWSGDSLRTVLPHVKKPVNYGHLSCKNTLTNLSWPLITYGDQAMVFPFPKKCFATSINILNPIPLKLSCHANNLNTAKLTMLTPLYSICTFFIPRRSWQGLGKVSLDDVQCSGEQDLFV